MTAQIFLYDHPFIPTITTDALSKLKKNPFLVKLLSLLKLISLQNALVENF